MNEPRERAQMPQERAPQGQNNVQISDEQMTGAIMAGIDFFDLETTLIPGNLRRQLRVLEMVFAGLRQGALVIASPDQLAVKSQADGGEKPPENRALRRGVKRVLADCGKPADESGDDDAEGRESTGSQEG